MIKILAKSGSLPTSRDFDFSGEGRLVAGELNLKDIFISIYNTQIPKMLSTSKMTLEDKRLERAPVEIDFITDDRASRFGPVGWRGGDWRTQAVAEQGVEHS